jgi:large conductance mechanosensitive channel
VLKGFREFVARGSVIDLAVGVVIGAAFTALVNSFVVNFINPLLGVFGTKSLSAYVWCLKAPDGGGTCVVDPKTGAITGVGIGWGAMLSAIITFLLTALVVYFVFVVPMNKYRQRHATPEAEETAEEITLLREIRDSLRTRDAGA